MIFTEEQRNEFKEVVRPLIKFMNDNCHPHVTVVVSNTRAELSEGFEILNEKGEQKMETQLHLPIIDLTKKGFKQGIHNDKTVFYKIDILNGHISFNPKESLYPWYLRTEIGNACNNIHLSIVTEAELNTLLKILQIKRKQNEQ